MTLELILPFLAWTTLINLGVLIFWAFFLMCAPDLIFNIQTRWIALSREEFNRIHFQLFGLYKLLIIFFNLIPYISLRLIT